MILRALRRLSAASLLIIAGVGVASAQSADQGEAFAQARSLAAADCTGRLGGSPTDPRLDRDTGSRIDYSYLCARQGGGNFGRSHGSATYEEPCSTRNTKYPPGDAALNFVPISDCVGSCKLVGERFTSTSGGVTVYGMRNRTYAGGTCDTQSNSNAPIDAQAERDQQTKPKQPECTGLGNGQTACQKPNGDYCATASTGKTFCWTPGQEGTQTDGNDAQVKSKQGDPVRPPDVKVPDTDWQRKEGHQVTECTGSSCKTSNVTNYGTVPQGTAKNSSGDNKADGSGNTSGNGKQGEGEGKDGKDSATESGNCETPPICTGDTLKCLQLKITWRIDCNTKGNEITDSESCGAGDVPVCAGKSCKAEEYSLLLRDWRRRCELKADAQAGANGGQGDDEAGVIGGLWASDGAPTPSFDTGKLSIGGGGDLIPSVEIFEGGQTFQVPQSWYSVLSVIKTIVIASAMVAAFWILARL